MKTNVVAPSVGESITEVSILKWAKQNGEAVKANELLLEIESDKATVEIVAQTSGTLQILKEAGAKVKIGEVVGAIDDSVAATVTPGSSAQPTTAAPARSTPPPPPYATGASAIPLSPAVQKIVTERGMDPSQIRGSGKDGRLTKGDLLNVQANTGMTTPPPAPPITPVSTPTVSRTQDGPGDRRVPMTRIRQRIAERLVQAQHTAAILTTFNEVDMTAINGIRAKTKDAFKAKHGVPLSFMSFFTRAAVEALKVVPAVNASIDGTDVLYHDYHDIGIAVGTERGLVVPVIRNAGEMGFLEIERALGAMAQKARDGKLTIQDMTGGTFTISNGGTYGSLLSTPILNPPQSGILGMHKIQERPMVVNGSVQARPMMYVALSYDHRLIDGKEAVTWLVTLKQFLEEPEKLGMEFINGL